MAVHNRVSEEKAQALTVRGGAVVARTQVELQPDMAMHRRVPK